MQNFLNVTSALIALKRDLTPCKRDFLNSFNSILKEFDSYNLKTVKKTILQETSELRYLTEIEFPTKDLFNVLDWLSSASTLWHKEFLGVLIKLSNPTRRV